MGFIVPNSSQWAPSSSTAAKTEPSTRSAQCSQPSSGDDVPPLRRLLPPCQPFHRVENQLEPTWPVTNIQVLKMIQWRFYIFGKVTNLCHLKFFLLVSACSYQPFSANQRCNLVINCDFNSSERTQVVVCIVCYWQTRMIHIKLISTAAG